MIYVHESPSYVRQDLDLILQLLTEIVGFPEGSVGVHDDVYLDVIVLIMREFSFSESEWQEIEDYIPVRSTEQVMDDQMSTQLYERMIEEGGKTHMIRSNSVHLMYLIREGRRLIREKLNELMRRRLPSKQLKLLVDSTSPGNDDTCCNLYCTHTRAAEMKVSWSTPGGE